MARGGAVRLDHGGIGSLLKSNEMQELVRDTADAVAENVASQGLTTEAGENVTAEVEPYITDRAAAAVMIDGPWGLGMQARHGALTKAASAAGLEVTEKDA
jgi:hypothetical protein